MPTARLDKNQRLCAAALSIAMLLLIVGAHFISPDVRGYGTHERLGLLPCPTMQWFNVPCPFCGSTTAFVLMAQSRPADAFKCQPTGALAFCVVIYFAIRAMAVALTGSFRYFSMHVYLWLSVPTGVLLIFAWIYKIAVVRSMQ